MANIKSVNYELVAKNSMLYQDENKDSGHPLIYSNSYECPSMLGKILRLPSYKSSVQKLEQSGIIQENSLTSPPMAIDDELLLVHSQGYMSKLKSKAYMARKINCNLVRCMSVQTIEENILKPLKMQLSGSVVGTKVAVEKRYAINFGGGFSLNNDNIGLNVYDDIHMCLKYLNVVQDLNRVLLIDSSNSITSGCCKCEGITYKTTLSTQKLFDINKCSNVTSNKKRDNFKPKEPNFKHAESELSSVLSNYNPQFIIYCAGQATKSSQQRNTKYQIQQDLLVFYKSMKHQVPLLMLTGGYQNTLGDSIEFLLSSGLINI